MSGRLIKTPSGIVRKVQDEGMEMLDFEMLQKQAYDIAFTHGWWDGTQDDAVRQHLLKLHEEAVEAHRAWRSGESAPAAGNGKPCGLPSELADVVIVAMNIAERLGIDLEAEILRKHKYNAGRPYRHGGER